MRNYKKIIVTSTIVFFVLIISIISFFSENHTPEIIRSTVTKGDINNEKIKKLITEIYPSAEFVNSTSSFTWINNERPSQRTNAKLLLVATTTEGNQEYLYIVAETLPLNP